ncbi:MAG: hypothetical protein ACRCZJ_07425 [Erysipelotrichaceae bacterium]
MKSDKLMLASFIVVAIYIALAPLVWIYGISQQQWQLETFMFALLCLHSILLMCAFVFHMLAYAKHTVWACVTSGTLYSVALFLFPFSLPILVFPICACFIGIRKLKKQWIYKIS